MRLLLLLLLQLSLLLPAQAQYVKTFRPGYYIDINGTQHQGFIRYRYDHRNFINYKTAENEEDIVLKPKQIKGFVIDTDSFTVISYFDNGKQAGYKGTPIIVEVKVAGPITLLKHYFASGNVNGYQGMGNGYGGGTEVENYYLMKGTSPLALLVKKNKKAFKQTMQEYFMDAPEIAARIERGDYTWEFMEAIVKEYNKQQTVKPGSVSSE